MKNTRKTKTTHAEKYENEYQDEYLEAEEKINEDEQE